MVTTKKIPIGDTRKRKKSKHVNTKQSVEHKDSKRGKEGPKNRETDGKQSTRKQ